MLLHSTPGRPGSHASCWLPITLLAALLLAGCASLGQIGSKPTARFDKLQLSDAGLLDSTLNFTFLIANPNPLALRAGRIDYDLTLNGVKFARGRLDRGVTLPAYTTVPLVIPFKIRYLDFFASMAEMVMAGKVAYALAGTFSVGGLDLPLRAAGTFDLPRLPSVEMESLAIQRLTLATAELNCRLKVENPNDFSMKFKRLYYELQLDGLPVAKLEVQPQNALIPKGEGTIESPFTVSLVEAGHALYDLLSAASQSNYRLDAMMVFDSPSGGIETVPFITRGRVPLTR